MSSTGRCIRSSVVSNKGSIIGSSVGISEGAV